jgi:predicted nuclease of predicted toxin-antitoxin system
MLFKFDENLQPDAAEMFGKAGHEALTVYHQGLRGHGDDDVAEVCHREGRALVTLDLDFADVRSYPSGDYPGIIVLRVVNQSRATVVRVLGRILPLLASEPVTGRLWIVDDFQVRFRGADTETTP